MSVSTEKDLTIVRLPTTFAPDLIDAIKAAILANRSPGTGRVHLIVSTEKSEVTLDLGLKTIPPTPRLSKAITDVIAGSDQRLAS